MTKALIDMISELQEDVPAVDGIPTDAQYERAIRDAVSEFSRRCGVKKNTTISVVSGTADYALPDDFMSLVEIDNPFDPEHKVVITATGIISFNGINPFEEEITIHNNTLSIYPTPSYSMVRYLEYKAAWILDEDGNYPLTEDEVRIVMLKAKAICFEKLSNAGSSAGFKYSVGNFSVDKSSLSDGYSKRTSNLEAEFVKACDRYNGTVVM